MGPREEQKKKAFGGGEVESQSFTLGTFSMTPDSGGPRRARRRWRRNRKRGGGLSNLARGGWNERIPAVHSLLMGGGGGGGQVRGGTGRLLMVGPQSRETFMHAHREGKGRNIVIASVGHTVTAAPSPSFSSSFFSSSRNRSRVIAEAAAWGQNPTTPDPYRVLGVSPQAEMKEIKQAYRKLCLATHPDVNKEEGARERFLKVREAYALLSDAEQRAIYDRSRGFQWRGGGGTGKISEEERRRREEEYRKKQYEAYRDRRRANAGAKGMGSGGREEEQGRGGGGHPPRPSPRDEFYGIQDLFHDLSEDWEREEKEKKRKKEEIVEGGGGGEGGGERTSRPRVARWVEDLVDFLEDSAGLSGEGRRRKEEEEDMVRRYRREKEERERREWLRKMQTTEKGGEGKKSKVDDMLEDLKREMGLD